MAGDTKETASGVDLAPPTVDDPFPGIQQTLDAILAEESGDGLEIVGPFSIAAGTASNRISQYPRIRVRALVLSTDIAATITLILGTRRYPFVMPPSVAVIPFPFVIERGSDMSVEASVAVTLAAYIIGRPE